MAASVGVGSWHTFTLNFGAPVDLFRVEQPETGQLVIHLCSQQDVLAAVQYRLTRLQPSVHIPAADAGTTSLVMPFSGCYGSDSVDQLCRELGIVAQSLNSVDQRMEASADTSETNGQISDSTDTDLPDFLCSVFNNKDNSIRLDPVSSTDPVNAAMNVNTSQSNAQQLVHKGTATLASLTGYDASPQEAHLVHGAIESRRARSGSKKTLYIADLNENQLDTLYRVSLDNGQNNCKQAHIFSSPPVFPQREVSENKSGMFSGNSQPLADHSRSVQLATLMAAVVKNSSSSSSNCPATVSLMPNHLGHMPSSTVSPITYQLPALSPVCNITDSSYSSGLVPRKSLSTTTSSNAHVCPHCNLQFNRHCNLQRHVSLVHAMGGKTLASKVCPLCRVMKCRQYKPLIDHVMSEHQIAARIDSIQFASDVAFHGWKRELECRSGASFVQKSGSKAVKKTINTYFACNRSGAAVNSMGEKKKGKSKEEAPTCIAFIRTAKCMESGSIQATYCLTHLGH